MTLEIVPMIFVLLFSVVIHECAHGWTANKCGDPTAKILGRLTLNPLKHIDPIGTIAVPLILHLLNAPMLGWAKPVPVNFSNLHNPKRDMIYVAAAGPISNIAIAVILSLFLPMKMSLDSYNLIAFAIVFNLLLAIFNLFPVPPLDGGRILVGLLPRPMAKAVAQLEPFGMLIVLVLLNFGFFHYVWNAAEFIAKHLGVV